jgi:hypothetical protein
MKAKKENVRWAKQKQSPTKLNVGWCKVKAKPKKTGAKRPQDQIKRFTKKTRTLNKLSLK